MLRPDEIADYRRFAYGEDDQENFCQCCGERFINGVRLSFGKDDLYYCQRHENDVDIINDLRKVTSAKDWQILQAVSRKEFIND
jgi:hypothetical protein